MNTENKLGVALVKRACKLCGKLENSEILLNSRLSESEAKKVENLHQKVIGYLDSPCKECQELMKKGFLIIEVDEEKTDDKTNPYKTGRQFVVRPEFIERTFGKDYLRLGAAFLTDKTCDYIGIPRTEDTSKVS
jgi:hypothetical protein